MKHLILTLTILIFTFCSYCQTYSPKKYDEVKGKSRGAAYIGMDDKGYIYTTSFKIRHFGIVAIAVPFVKVFDSRSGQIVTEKKLNNKKQLKAKGYEYVSFTFFEDQPVIICKKKKASKKGFYYFGFEVDHKMNIKSKKPFKYSRYQKCKGFLKSGAGGLTKTYDHIAEDGTTTVVSNLTCDATNAKKQRLLIIQLDGEEHKELRRLKTNLEIPAISRISTVSNGDKIYLSIQTSERQKIDGKLLRRMIYENRFFVINEDDEVIEIELKLSKDDYRMGHFKLFANEGEVILNGQVLKNETNSFIGVFSGRIIPQEDDIQDLDIKLFDVDFVSQYLTDRQKKKTEKRAAKKGGDVSAGGFILMDYLKTDDEGAVNLYQKYRVVVHTTTTTNSSGVSTTKQTYYYYYEDVIAVKTSKEGELDWVKLIPIQQVTTNFDPGMGYVATQKEGEIFLMHRASNKDAETINEGSRQKRGRLRDRMPNKVAITKISNKGELTSEIITQEKQDKIYFLPNEVAVDEKNQRFIMLNTSRKLFSRKKTVVQSVSL